MAKLADVNTSDVAGAIRLGCETMGRVFNSEDEDRPYWGSRVWPEARFGFFWPNADGHVPGRHLNALLNAEDAVGVKIDEESIEKHARAAFFACDGAIPLPLTRNEYGGPAVNFAPHHVREGFHALYALAAFRKSEPAMELAKRAIAFIFDRWSARDGWDWAHIEGALGLNNTDRRLLEEFGPKVGAPTFITGLGRAIGPLVKLYRATGYGPSLDLAVELKNKAVDEFFLSDGSYDSKRFGAHTHSTTCVLSSLAQLGDLLADSQLMAVVKAFYDNGLWEIRDELGWVMESSRDDSLADLGEANNTGDIVETALILGRWGWPQYYEDAERMVRCHLLPSQLRDISFITEPPNPDGKDCLRDVGERNRGAWGFPAPYGLRPIDARAMGFHMDIVGGVVGSLCEVHRQIVRSDEAGHWVNLHFDHETPAVAVESPYTHDGLRVRVCDGRPVFVRIPSWVEPAGVSVSSVTGRTARHQGYFLIPEPPVDQWVSISFPLADREITLKHSARDIRVRLSGDAVSAMDSFDTDLTFFDPIN